MTTESARDLYISVESLRLLLTSHATGGEADNVEYRTLREKIVQNQKLRDHAPRFLMSCRSLDDFWSFIKGESSTYQGRRNYLRDKFDPLLTMLETAESTPSDSEISESLSKVDAAHIHSVWERALERRSNDPEGAITLARTLLEAVCKHILDELGVEYADKADLPKIYSLVAKNLNLSPSQHSEQIFKHILGGCHSVVQGLGSLRSKLGDAHAQGKIQVKPAPRHAELAVNLSGTMATFLIATWEARNQS